MDQGLGEVARLGASERLPDRVSRLLARADLRIAPQERSIGYAPGLGVPFTVEGGHVRLGPACLETGEAGAAVLRHALELALLLPRLTDAVLAGLASARVAALFAQIHGVAREGWHAVFAAEVADREAVVACWGELARLQPGVGPVVAEGSLERLAECWGLLGPAEGLLQLGGDQRLRVDPATGLNHYGCSHRPRPWAVTFASSTASSSSERGFAEAEAARQRTMLAALRGGLEPAVAAEGQAVRAEIAQALALPVGSDVVLAASGTDCEVLALALAVAEAPAGMAVANLVVAPDETGSGVPLAAVFCHFAPDTARGQVVVKGERIAGMARAVRLVGVPARGADGGLRDAEAVDAAVREETGRAVAAGEMVVLHLLDMSKTGYIAPTVGVLRELCGRFGDAVRVVVDACQLRCGRERLANYLAWGWLVQVTGSKFLTGPPFAGAVLVPQAMRGALGVRVPKGLAAYSSRAEWPEGAATGGLPGLGNLGLLLRWRAALGELRAFEEVEPGRRRAIVERFCGRVREAVGASADLALLEVGAPDRDGNGWDGVQSIVGFMARQPEALGPAEARLVYDWLNADLRPALPAALSAEEERLACLRCHIGQPVPLLVDGRMVGVLRISAGARLVSGEPSHHDLDEDARLLREIADALSVLGKVSLILRHWEELFAANPRPSF